MPKRGEDSRLVREIGVGRWSSGIQSSFCSEQDTPRTHQQVMLKECHHWITVSYVTGNSFKVNDSVPDNEKLLDSRSSQSKVIWAAKTTVNTQQQDPLCQEYASKGKLHRITTCIRATKRSCIMNA